MQGYCQENLAFHHKTLTTPYFQAPIFSPFFFTAYFKKQLTKLAVIIGSLLGKGALLSNVHHLKVSSPCYCLFIFHSISKFVLLSDFSLSMTKHLGKTTPQE